MIIGLGTDIVYIPRIEKLIKKFGTKFEHRYFTLHEIESASKYSASQQRSGHFSKRFAAKEAFVKALGTGVREGIFLKDIGVKNDAYGKPHIELFDRTAETCEKIFPLDKHRIHLSLSDDFPVATATVILEEICG